MRFETIEHLLQNNTREDCWGSAELADRKVKYCLHDVNLRIETSNKANNINEIDIYLYYNQSLLFHLTLPHPIATSTTDILSNFYQKLNP